MAATLREAVGQRVGYRMRMDTRVSRSTRIEVVTEGVLTRMLQNDAALEGVAAVIFDEFHERSLQADLGLALAIDARDNLSPDLKLIVMSATLEAQNVASLLGDAPVITAHGRVFPVETRYVGKAAPLLPGSSVNASQQESPERSIALIVSRALREEHGDVLVFLPGAREIRRVQSLLEAARLDSSIFVLPLFGELSAEDQDAALTPSAPGTRKVVLATNIAETSLTIEGVRVVIDSGLVRRSVFDPATGMSRLETQRISRASAEQRQGRAGRIEPGVCYRAWSEGSQRSLAPFTPPEIVDADLTSLALELASWGARDAADLRWLDQPPAAMLASARDLLSHLGALDREGRITKHGRQLTQLGVHPRLAHMLICAAAMDSLSLAADLAALLSERDLLRGTPGSRDADIRTRLDVVRGEGKVQQVRPQGVDLGSLHRARRASRDLGTQVASILRQTSDVRPTGGAPEELDPSAAAGLLLAFAYPDRIGLRRPGSEGRYTLANGRGAHFAEAQALAKHELIVAVDLDDRERDARILLAAPLSRAHVEEYLSERLERSESVDWSSREQAVLARRVVRLDGIVLEEAPLPQIPLEAARAAMLKGIQELGIGALPWSRDARDLQARVEFVRRLEGERTTLPAMSDTALASATETWLAPWLDGVTRRDHLARLSLVEILKSLLTWEQQRKLDELAPTHLQVPSGSGIRIDYLDESAPAVSVRLQEVFGLDETPRIGGGAVPITFKLLSPAQRPVQVTRDLTSFWRGAYADVRKDLRGRYPKHYWPEDPLVAEPTRGVRRR
jgi:ATP-dependent helicase HrpB